MAFLNLGGKKREAPVPADTTPTELVLRMRQKGLTNNQIVQALQKNGYKTHQIFDAMNQADLQATGQPVSELEMPPAPTPEQPQFKPSREPEFMQEQTQPLYEEPAEPDYGAEEKIEEVAEAIIDEKWNELLKQVSKVIEWKNAMENKINVMEQQAQDLRADFETLQKGVVEKVSEYDRNIISVGTEIKAMEQVFKKILPTLTENVNTLSRITKNLKAKKS